MRTLEELTAQMNTLGADPLTGDAWFDQLAPEEREILLGQVVPHSRYTEPHDAAKRAAEARVQEYADDGPANLPLGDGFGARLESDLVGGDIFDDSAAPNEPTPLRDAVREAFAAGCAHAAAEAAAPGVKINVVITFADAARTFASHGLRALARRLRDLADRVEPDR